MFQLFDLLYGIRPTRFVGCLRVNMTSISLPPSTVLWRLAVNVMSEKASGVTNGDTPECPAVGVSGSQPLANGESEGPEKEELSCTAEEGFQTQTTVLEGEEGSQIDASVSEQTEMKVL